MKAFAPAGAVLTGHGRVTGTRSGGLVEVEIWTDSGGNPAAAGTAVVWLPDGSEEDAPA